MNSAQQMRELITEHISTQYAYISYGGFEKVIIMKDNGYINATKFCDAISKVVATEKEERGVKVTYKPFRNWKELGSSQEIIDECFYQVYGFHKYDPAGMSAGSSVTDVIFVIDSGLKETFGTYVHPLLINSIAMWISPKYAIYVNKLINEYYVKEKQDKIFSLEKMYKEMKEQHEETKSILISTRDNLEELRIEHEDTSFKLDR